MPYDAQGNYSLPNGTTVSTGDKVLPSQHNPAFNDVASTLSAVLVRDGRAPMTGDLPMGDHKITGLADGVDDTDAATKSQVDATITGPSSAVDGNFVAFDGTSGTLGKDSGKKASDFATSAQGTKADGAAQATDLASTAASKGASLVGVQDSEGNFTGTTVEAVLAELRGLNIGVGQTWQDVSASRILNTSYRNTTGRPIQVSISVNKGAGAAATMSIQVSNNNVNWIKVGGYGGYSSGGGWTFVSIIVPDNMYYRALDTGSGSDITGWAELR